MTRTQSRNPWLALLVLCLGNFAILLDTTIVNTAAPRIMSTLGANIDDMLWVINAYLLAFAALLILFGRLGDLVGPRNAFVAGLVLFNAASAFCGLAHSPTQLIVARVAQGMGAAMLTPQALVLISAIFPAERRGGAFGIFSAVTGIAAVSGPTLGGLLVTNLSWPWIFYLNLPIGLAGIVLSFLLVPDLRPGSRHRLDAVGVLLASAGLLAVMFGLIEGQRYNWGTVSGALSIPLIIGFGVLLLIGFVAWESRHPEPLVPLRLFRVRNFTLATVINVAVSFALFGFLIAFVLATQTVLGMSPLLSGLTALPMTVTLSAFAPVAGRLTDRVGGRRLLLVGLTTYALGIAGLAWVLSGSATTTTFLLPLIVAGAGMGFVFAPMTTEAMRDITPQMSGAASGVLNTARQIGSALGAAVVGAVLQNRLLAAMDADATRRSAELPAQFRTEFVRSFHEAAHRGLALGTGQTGGIALPADLPAPLAARVQGLIHDIFVSAFLNAARPALAVVVGVLLAAAVCAALMVRRHRPVLGPDAVPAAREFALDADPAR
jgi:EmrB/QacA subfamily drug resistance transporter